MLDSILALGAPPIRACRLDIGDFDFAGAPPAADGIDYAVAPRRTALDKLLLDAAVEAGADARLGFYVGGIEIDNGRICGIRGRGAHGGTVVEKARLVVGADGAHSLIAHWVRARKYHTRPSSACAYYAYWSGGPAVSEFETYVRPGWAGAIFATSDGLTCAVAGWNDSFSGAYAAPEQGYREVMAGIPRFTELRDAAERVEHLYGIRELPGFFRQPWGDGWALAGDAGHHKHPLSAQGISDAFRDADLLSQAIDAGFSGRAGLHDALADYQHRRDEVVMPVYESTCQRALLEQPPPEAMALFRALRHNPEAAGRFFGTDAGTLPFAEFFAPENISAIMRAAPAAGGAGRS